MTTSSNKKDLPPNWIVKTSRQYPSLYYYANVKTGQSTWKHPSLLKESEIKCLTKKKRKKNLKEDSSEEAKVVATTSSGKGLLKQESRPSKKAKSIPLNSEHFATSQSDTKKQATAQNDTQVKENTIGGHKSLKNQEKLDGRNSNWKALDNNEESTNTTEDHKLKPIKFTIKKKNVLSISSVTDSSLKKPATIHPSILLAQKIAARDLQTKRKNQGDRRERLVQDEVQNAKIKGGKKETSEVPVDATKSVTSETKSELKSRELLKSYEIEKSLAESVKKIKGWEREKEKKKHEKALLSSSDTGPISRLHEKGRKGAVVDKDKQRKDIEEKKRKEDKMYEDFIKRRSKEWNKSKYKCQSDKHESTLKLEVSSDEEHSKSLCKTVIAEQPKKKILEDDLNFGLPSQQVPYKDSAKVFEPLSESVPAGDISVIPKATDMEIDEEELITEIANFRGSASYFGLTPNDSLSAPTAQYSSTSIYFVVDTNVLIRDVDFLEQLKSAVIDGREIVVVIPYVVVQEMDGLKKSASIGSACQVAVKWCNRHFEAQDRRVLGETYSNYCNSLKKNKKANADDLVRDCCLLLANEGLDVCLLTNDVNLRNKAIMSNLAAVGAKDLKNKLKIFPSSHLLNSSTSKISSQTVCTFEESQMSDVNVTECVVSVADTYNLKPSQHLAELSVSLGQHKGNSDQKTSRVDSSFASEDNILHEKISTSLHHTLGHILQDVMKEVYEDLWLTVVKHKPPWTLEEVFACWDKHWIAVMIERFPSNMKELLEEINNLVTSSQDDAQKLFKRVQFLYSHFESKQYNKHILPIQDPFPDTVDMSEAPSVSTPPHTSSLPEPHQHSPISGVVNVEKMINQVGAHITHFVALVLTAFGIQHKLPTIGNSELMTPDNARISGINLHQVIMSLGTAITKCLNERTSAALQELGHLLVNFWLEAKLPCPHLPFTECDLRQFVENPSNMPFLEGALQELESLIQQLRQILAGP